MGVGEREQGGELVGEERFLAKGKRTNETRILMVEEAEEGGGASGG
jgi:hypothetical protein